MKAESSDYKTRAAMAKERRADAVTILLLLFAVVLCIGTFNTISFVLTFVIDTARHSRKDQNINR